MSNILSKKEIKDIKVCGKILKDSLNEVKNAVKPGVSTLELDKIAEDAIVRQGAVPSFKDYEVKGSGNFPFTTCVSINDEVVHGLPSKRIINNGDVVSLDLGAIYNGVCTDMAITLPVGDVSESALKLISVTRECLNLGINEAKAGKYIGDIGNAVQTHAERNKFGVVRDLVGHGIGTEPHMQPSIPNFGKKGAGAKIIEGMALAIEPMLTEGNYEVKVGMDGWTVLTRDGSIAAHFEHTIVIVEGKPIVVTA